MLTQEELKRLFRYDPETGKVMWINTYRRRRREAGQFNNRGYLVVSIDGTYYKLHRLIWLYVYGKSPESQIDHINGDPADNRLINLREATSSQNRSNSKIYSNNKSGTRGVFWDKEHSKWMVQIRKLGSVITRRFESLEEAEAFAEAIHLEIHGEYSALLNR